MFLETFRVPKSTDRVCVYRYLERLVKDHEDTIRELEDENAGVYDLLTEQKALDKSMGVARSSASILGIATARSSADAHTGLEVETKREGYVVCSRCRDKLGAERDQPSKLGSLRILLSFVIHHWLHLVFFLVRDKNLHRTE